MDAHFGIRVIEVEAGHVVTDTRTGETMAVQDGEVVAQGHTLYVTAKDYAAIKASVLPAPARPQEASHG